MRETGGEMMETSEEPGAASGNGRCTRRRVGDLTVEIDRTLCVGFGDCITTAPEAFELDDEGVAVFAEPEAVARWRLLDACAACPVDALTAYDSEGNRLVP